LEQITKELFTEWQLDTWANILEIVGFGITIISLIIALFVKSELTRLKLSYIFDNRIKDHSKALKKITSGLNRLFDEYDTNRDLIKSELSICVSELQDMRGKLGFWKGLKTRFLIFFIRRRLTKKFELKKENENTFLAFILKYPNRIYKTTYEDNWLIYCKLNAIIRQIDNIKKNKDKSL